MNKYFRFLLPTIAFIFLFMPRHLPVSAQMCFGEILQRIGQQQQVSSSSALKSSYQDEQVNSQLGENDSNGRES
jgi:hypothetical protein